MAALRAKLGTAKGARAPSEAHKPNAELSSPRRPGRRRRRRVTRARSARQGIHQKWSMTSLRSSSCARFCLVLSRDIFSLAEAPSLHTIRITHTTIDPKMRTAEFSVCGFRVWVCDGAFGTRFSPSCGPWMNSGIGMVLRVSPLGTLGLVPLLSELNLNFERANAKTPQNY